MRAAIVTALLLLAALTAPQPAIANDGGPAQGAGSGADDMVLPIVFPEHAVNEDDAYLCTSVTLPQRPLKLVGIEPTSDQRIVHHMLLFGCTVPASADPVWDCKMAATCAAGSDVVLYGWGKNAPAIAMPQGVGYSVGPGTGIRSLVLQMHYLKGRPANDTSGIRLRLSAHAVPYSAGMVAFAAGFTIPPGQPSTLVPNSCCYSGWEPLRGFATRVHTHAMGREVYLNRTRPADRSAMERVVGLDPQQPQGFYPVEPEAIFLPGDQLSMACNFDSTGVSRQVHAGHTSSDEMCNLYLMLYSHLPFFMWCLDGHAAVSSAGPGGLPKDGLLQPEMQLWQPSVEVESSNGTAAEAGATGTAGAAAFYPLGQVSGLASNGDGTIWAFHRGKRAWNPDGTVSDSSGKGTDDVLNGPVVLQLEQDSGKVLRSWGAGQFVMPHMVTLDYEGNLWLTDVALHQALKFSPKGEQLLALGTRLQSGDGATAFCQPTQVAPARDGCVFVSDGYCNSRVAEFAADGTWVRDYRLPTESMLVPHSVVYEECREMLVVADRERGRVHAFKRGTGAYLGEWNLHEQYGMPYSLAMGPYGAVLALAWQPQAGKTWVLVLDLDAVGSAPRAYEVPGGLEAPHDIALLPAPLELTGSGERLLSVVISETREGRNMHKYVLAELSPDAAPAGASGAEAGEEEGAELDDAEVSLAAAKAAAAAHFGGTHGGQHAGQQAVAGGQEEQASRVGHSMVTPLDGGEPEQPQQQEAGGGGEQQPQDQQEQQQQEEGPDEAEQPGGSGVGASASAAEEATHIGHSMVKPVAEEEQQQGEEQQGEEQQGEPQQQAGAQAEEQQHEQHPEEQQHEQQPEEEAAAAVEAEQQQHDGTLLAQADEEQQHEEAAVSAAGAVEAGARSWFHDREDNHKVLGRAEAQPWALGVVFVGVALAAWSRLQHWRRRGGAGYHPPPGATANGGAGATASGAAAAAAAAAGVHRHHLVHGHLERGVSGDLPSPEQDV